MTNLPEGWLSCRLGDILMIRNGYAFKSKDFVCEGIPLVRQTELTGDLVDLSNAKHLPERFRQEYKRFLVRKGDILLGMSGSLGEPSIYSEDFPALQNQRTGLVVLALDDPALRAFALKALRSTEKEYSQKGKGIGVQNVSASEIEGVELLLPPLPEQRRIVAKLDRLSARSRAARDHLARTTTLAARAKQAITRQLIRERTWETADFLEVCEAYQPRTISKAQMKPDGRYPVFGANGKIGFYDEFNHENPELLVTCRGATCGAVNVSEPFSWINGNAMVIRGKQAGYALDFMKAYFSHGFDFSDVISGSAQPQITRQSLAKLQMPVVPLEEQDSIVRRIESAFARIDRLTEEAGRAAHLLDRLDERLLARAFRGELVPQDPADEPAAHLLARIREARAAAPKPTRRRRAKA